MNIEHLRQALKSAWLNYYRQNRDWIVRLSIWVNYQDQRRPSASFMLGALSMMEPQLTQLLPLVVDLNSNPDRIIVALGLNFNPEEELEAVDQAVKLLPSELHRVEFAQPKPPGRVELQQMQPEPTPMELPQTKLSQLQQSQPKPPAGPPKSLNQNQNLNQNQYQKQLPDIKSSSPPIDLAQNQTENQILLDTAELKTHEQPRPVRRNRNRQPSRWD